MDALFNLLRSLLSYLFPTTLFATPQPTKGSNSAMDEVDRFSSALQCLPAEIIVDIVGFLPPQSLAKFGQTCHLMHTHCNNDLLWANFVQRNTPTEIESHYPFKTWRDLYLAHHPYWFLTRHKIWFADRAVGGNSMTGTVIIARYDPRRGCIEAYRLVAEHGDHTFETWEWNTDVIIHTFNPRVQLWLDDPVVKLDPGREKSSHPRSETMMQEIMMQTGLARGLRSALSLCQAIPESRWHRSMALWPPAILPARHRVRSESSTMFRDVGHKPKTFEDASDQTFRLRKWLDFRGMDAHLGVKVGEDVMTFSTLLEESYTPSEQKPWQGIWVGDYSGHGCEFLVVLQKDVDPNVRPIRPTPWTEDSLHSLINGSSDEEFDMDMEDGQGLEEDSWLSAQTNEQSPDTVPSMDVAEASDDPSCRGRLEAIKLTGDPNVPRGEYTWIAEDIGPKGLVRVADEQMFKGARVVRSLGHCAARGFRNDRYVASQLIMVSHDTLAQYWEDFGHVSFYKRIDIDQYLHV